MPALTPGDTVVMDNLAALASVSEALIDLYTTDEINLAQLMAFSVTLDHARQEQVWAAIAKSRYREAYRIRRMLTEGAVRASDRRALFVGVAAYEEAGGTVLRDLFQHDDGGWLQDPALLDRLALGKLQAEAKPLADDLFMRVSTTGGCLEVSVRHIFFAAQASDLKDSASAKAIEERKEAWAADMPADDQALWDWLDALDLDSRLALLAHCVSYGVNALVVKIDRYGGAGLSQHGLDRRMAQANRIARAVKLDMAEAGWTPTSDNYLGRVTKGRILEAVREAKGEQAAKLIDCLKKGDMAKEANGSSPTPAGCRRRCARRLTKRPPNRSLCRTSLPLTMRKRWPVKTSPITRSPLSDFYAAEGSTYLGGIKPRQTKNALASMLSTASR